MTAASRLPGDTSDFADMRERRQIYIAKMLETRKYHLLARPRRFGKTLLVSTLEYLFQGRTELFAGTAIHERLPRSSA